MITAVNVLMYFIENQVALAFLPQASFGTQYDRQYHHHHQPHHHHYYVITGTTTTVHVFKMKKKLNLQNVKEKKNVNGQCSFSTYMKKFPVITR